MNYENLKAACKAKGTSLTAYVESIGLDTGNTGRWRHGGNPSIPVLVRMANDLEVTTDYLLGRADNPSRDTAPPDEHWLVKAYNRASDDDKGIVNLALNKYREEAALETHMVKRAI